MTEPHNLKSERVVKAFKRAGWTNRVQKGSHVKLTKEENSSILSIQAHKGHGSIGQQSVGQLVQQVVAQIATIPLGQSHDASSTSPCRTTSSSACQALRRLKENWEELVMHNGADTAFQ